MSITFPKTWSSGEILKAADIKANLDSMRDKGQNFVSADMDTSSQWVATPHVMKGSYNSITNISTFVSGVVGGRNNKGFWQNTSYVSRWLCNPNQGTDTQQQFVPLSTLNFDITQRATIFFQWFMNHQSPTDTDGFDAHTAVFPYFISEGQEDFNLDDFYHYAPEQEYPNSVSALIDGSWTTNGFYLIQDTNGLSSNFLNFGIGLMARGEAGKCQQASWSVSVECFYM